MKALVGPKGAGGFRCLVACRALCGSLRNFGADPRGTFRANRAFRGING